MNIEEKIERDQKKYDHVRRSMRPGAKINGAYHTFRKSAGTHGHSLDFSKEELIQRLYTLGFSELYAAWRDSGVRSEFNPKILRRKRTADVTLDNIFITTEHAIEQDYQQGLRRCTTCDEKKSLSEYSRNRIGSHGLYWQCKDCGLLYHRTIGGLIRRIYLGQRDSCKRRKHPTPGYTKQELSVWLHENGLEALYEDWVASGYKKDKIPSVDRLDSLKPYTFDNLELVTWEENNRRAKEDQRNGVGSNGRVCKSVYQYSLKGEYLNEYVSRAEAARDIGTDGSSISAVMTGKMKSAGGFLWKDTKT